MEELSKYRGCMGCLVAVIVLGITGAMGVYITGSQEPPPVLMLGGVITAIALGVGIWKDTRWARIPSGVLLSLSGAALAVFILVDFATYLTGGESALSGPGGGSFGEAVFILFMTGIGLLGLGLYLLGRLRPS